MGLRDASQSRGALMVGLGCEVFQIDRMKDEYGMVEAITSSHDHPSDRRHQENVAEGVERIKAMLPIAAKASAKPVGPRGHARSAMRRLGRLFRHHRQSVARRRRRHVGQAWRHACARETPEIYGAEHLLTRARSIARVGEKLVERIRWWEDYTKRNSGDMNNNPRPATRPAGSRPFSKNRSAPPPRAARHRCARLRICAADQGQGLRVHGYAGYDPVGATGRSRALQRHVLHTGAARHSAASRRLDQARDEYRRLYPHDRRHGHQLRRCARRRFIEQKGEEIFKKVSRVASGEHTKSEISATATSNSCPGRSAR
jgi:altronate hydrolase